MAFVKAVVQARKAKKQLLRRSQMNNHLRNILGATALLACGSFNSAQAEVQPYIVNGESVAISQLPSTVALLNNSRLERTGSAFQAQFCGGTLIRSNWVVTAAHCLVDSEGVAINPAAISILAGSDNLEFPNFEPTPVARVIVHEEYTNSIFSDDIALLELAEDAPAQPMAIRETPVLNNEQAYVAGWGQLAFAERAADARYARELQMIRVRLIPGQECENLDVYTFIDTKNQVCGAPIRNEIASSCFGDSGGPVYSVNAQNYLRLTGVVSRGIECGVDLLPEVYTNVLSYTNWIDSHIAGNTSTGESSGESTNESTGESSGDSSGEAVGVQTRQQLSASGSAGCVFLPLLFVILIVRRRLRTIDLMQ